MAETSLPAGLPTGYAALWPVFQKQVALYNYGNTSMRDETAQRLMEGVRFTVELGGAAGSIQERYTAGQKQIYRLLRTARTLLAGVQKTALSTENLSYTHTLAALPQFFKAYDRHFFPQDIPCDIDYQTALPMLNDSSQGIAWYHEYLRRLLLENQFCALIPTEALTGLLWGAYPALREDLVNLFTPALLAALAAGLLGRDSTQVGLNNADRAALRLLLDGYDEAGLGTALGEAAHRLCRAHFAGNHALPAYVQEVLAALVPGIYRAVQSGELQVVFPSPAGPVYEAAESYEEGALLPAGRLRAIIAEARDCRHTADKLAILRREIHSLRDFTDFVDTCLWDNEYPAAFALLTETECAILARRLDEEYGPDDLPRWGQLFLGWLRREQ